jgi:hypothetical protein
MRMQNQVLSPLKTTARRRVVPADDLVLTSVTAHITRWTPGSGGLIVTNRCGRPVQRNSFGHCWREAVAAARTCGRPPTPPRERGACTEGDVPTRRTACRPAPGITTCGTSMPRP